MFICCTDCQDCSVTTNIIWGENLKSQPTLFAACSDEQTHVNFPSNAHDLRAVGSRRFLITNNMPDGSVLDTTETVVYEEVTPSRPPGCNLRWLQRQSALEDVAVAKVWNGGHRSLSLPAYYGGEHIKQWQKKVLATDILSYPLLNEQSVEASPHFQSIEIILRFQSFLKSTVGDLYATTYIYT